MTRKKSQPLKKSRSKSKAGRKVKARKAVRKTASRGVRSSRRRTRKPAKARRPAKRPLRKKKTAPKAKARKSRNTPQKRAPHSAKKARPDSAPRKSPAVAKAPVVSSPKPAKLNGKSAGKPQPGAAKPLARAPGKPSAGEIAARLSAKRTEKALAEGKAKSGKNGVELRKLELTPAEAEARKTRLKNLIVLGKERSYLTYAEINDHLPDDILDAEQIEGIISMINDMGIQVSDEAPTAAVDDVDEEVAEAAVLTLDSEFGRTTDPVRMYMREMGSVELLTREGEIEIAKRIEEGLKHMIM